MSRDPREYRVNAMRCGELAAAARTSLAKLMFQELSEGWGRLALDIEKTEAVLGAVETDYKKLD